MRDITIAFYSIKSRLFNSFLSIFLTAFGISIAIIITQIGNDLSKRINADGKNIDLVVGAKGSPLQLVLSSIYHVDIPNGNIPYSKARNLMKHPQIKKSIPLALGDNWNGHRIVGTNLDYLGLYNAVIKSGKLWNKEFEIVAGSSIKVDINSEIYGSHGLSGEGDAHENEKYKVVGILKPTGTVIDRLLLTDINSVLKIHGHEKIKEFSNDVVHNHNIEIEEKIGHSEILHDDHHEDHHHKSHDNTKHNDDEKHNEAQIKNNKRSPKDSEIRSKKKDVNSLISEETESEITALLIQTKSPIANMNLPNLINRDSEFLAANPALEIVRLSAVLGIGSKSFGTISLILIFMSILSIFAGLMGNLENRMGDLAILRALGYTKSRILKILSIEGLLLVVSGIVLGLLMSIGGLMILVEILNPLNEMKISFHLEEKTLLILLIVFFFGFLASFIPAYRNSKLSVAQQLSRNI